MSTEVRADLIRADWQAVLFSAQPRRGDLLRLKVAWPCQRLQLNVYRNAPFELLVPVLAPFLAYAGWEAQIYPSAFDDSLAFLAPPIEQEEVRAGVSSSRKVELFWLDRSHYTNLADRDFRRWLKGRVGQLRARSLQPILVVLLDPRADLRQTNEQRLRRTLAGLAGVTVAPVAALAHALGADFSQTRLANRTAGWLSDQAMIALARALACQWLPPLIEPRFKVLALDLDNTLYMGALGEEGAARLRLTTAHRRLQQQLIRLAQSGVLLTLVSKNKPTDVATLWTERSDFPLHREHFVATAIGWQPKSQLLAELAAELHLGLEAFILVDDNPGELAAVAAGTPCATLWAGDPVLTQQTLRYFPGLVGYPPDENALVRAQDLKVQNQRRALVTQSHDLLDYLSSLKVCLTLAFKPHAQVARIHELSGKTNQFNTALARLSEAAVAQRLVDPNFVTISIALRDRLTDAGVIGVLQAHGENHCVVVDELLISCRALGRGVEDAIAGEALLRAATYFRATKIHFTLVEGPRNEPARSWVNDLCDTQNEVAVTTVMARVAKLRPALSIGWQGES